MSLNVLCPSAEPWIKGAVTGASSSARLARVPDQSRPAGLEHSHRRCTAVIHEGRDLGVGVSANKATDKLVTVIDANQPSIMLLPPTAQGQHLFKHNRRLDAIGFGQRTKLQRVATRTLAGVRHAWDFGCIVQQLAAAQRPDNEPACAGDALWLQDLCTARTNTHLQWGRARPQDLIQIVDAVARAVIVTTASGAGPLGLPADRRQGSVKRSPSTRERLATSLSSTRSSTFKMRPPLAPMRWKPVVSSDFLPIGQCLHDLVDWNVGVGPYVVLAPIMVIRSSRNYMRRRRAQLHGDDSRHSLRCRRDRGDSSGSRRPGDCGRAGAWLRRR